MKLKQLLAKSALAAGIGVAAFGLAGGLASAEPYVPPTPPPVPTVPDVPCVPAPDVQCDLAVPQPPPVPEIPSPPPIPQP
jgi:hypothetical protein